MTTTTKITESAEMKLPALTGSEKQIAWATDIRAKKLASAKESFNRIQSNLNDDAKRRKNAIAYQALLNVLLTKVESRFWIDNRFTAAKSLIAANNLQDELLAEFERLCNEAGIKAEVKAEVEEKPAEAKAEVKAEAKAEAKNAARFAKEELETEYEIGNLEERYNVAKEIVRYRVNSKGTKCWSVYGVYDNKQIKVNGIIKSTAKTGWHNATAKVADDMLVQKVGITLVDYLNIEEFMNNRNNRKENQNQADAVNETKDELIDAPVIIKTTGKTYTTPLAYDLVFVGDDNTKYTFTGGTTLTISVDETALKINGQTVAVYSAEHICSAAEILFNYIGYLNGFNDSFFSAFDWITPKEHIDTITCSELLDAVKQNGNKADIGSDSADPDGGLIGAPEVNNNNISDRLAKLDEQKLNLYKAINHSLKGHYVEIDGEFYDAADAGFTTVGADSANPAFEKLYCKENGKFVEVPEEALKAFNLLEVEHLVTIKIIKEEEARNAVKFETGKYYTADGNDIYYVVKRTKTSVILFDCFYTQADGYMDINCDEDLDDEWEHKTFKAKIQFDERGEFVDWRDEEGELVTLHAKNQTDKPNNDDDPEKSTDDENSEDKLVDAPEVATNDNLTDALAQLAECKKLVDKANDEYLKLTFAVDACFHFHLNKLKAQIFDEHIHPNHKRDFETLNPMLKDIYDKIVAADHLKGWDIYGADIEYCTETAHTGASAKVYHIACDIFSEIRDKLGEETLADELKKIVAEFNLNPDLLLESDSCDFNATLFRDLTELTPNEILNEMGTRLTEGKEIWTNTDINAYSKACDRRVKEIKARLAENISDDERKSLLLEFETGYPAAYQEYIAMKIPVLDDDDDEELAKLKAQLDKATAEDDKLTDELFKAREAVKALEEKVFAAEDAKFKTKCAYYNRLHKKAEELTTQLITPEIFNSKAMQITFQSGKFSKIGSFFSTRIANHGEGWEIGKGFVIFGKYDTLAQVKVVINLLKEAIERGDKEFTFPTVEQLNASQVSKEKLNDSLVRAIKLAWAKAVDFYRAKNLTAAEYELKIYKICSDAQKELWEGVR